MNKNYDYAIEQLIKNLGGKANFTDFINYLTRPINNIHDTYINYEVFSSGLHINDPFPIRRNNKKNAIILQGPILHLNDFTRRTVELYLQLFNNPLIVISTWLDEDTGSLENISKGNVIILKNQPPKQKGFLNLNKQIVSTINALKLIKESNVNYVYKTRTDIRIQYENIEDFMLTLIENYALDKSASHNQNARIVLLDQFTFKYIPFHFSDIVQFGHIDDLIDYWNVELSKKSMRKSEQILLKGQFKVIDGYLYEMSEVYLGTQFAKLKTLDFEYNYKKYYDLLSKRFIIVDARMIGFMWHKNTLSGWQCTTSPTTKLHQTLLFKDWFLLYNDKVDLDNLEIEYNSKLNEIRDM